ncbi:type IV secretion system protein VirD4 [halophilic archaeon]|nr:type IV secretion system protein VirD4 [halophilic archaeon]
MIGGFFGGDPNDRDDRDNSDDEPAADETAVTGELYDITPVDSEYVGGVEAFTTTEDEGVVAGPTVRRILEGGHSNPEKDLWVGFTEDPQEGFREAGIPFDSLFRHLWIAGVTGAGKTTELLNWMVQLAFAGQGFVYFDPKGKDSRELLRMLPEHRLDDVVWVEPGTERDREVGLNLLDVPETDSAPELETAIENRLENLKAALAAKGELHATMESVTESLGRAMMHANADPDAPDYGVIDFYFVLLDQGRRESFAEECDDPYISEFLAQIADMDDEELRPLMKRVKAWVENGVVRRIIARRESTVEWRDVIDEDRIVIVRTPVENTDIKRLTTLAVMRGVWSAVQNRSYETTGQPEPYFVFADEFDDIASAELDLKSMLARARSMRLSVTAAVQYPSQLDSEVLKPMKNNADNLVTFTANDADDARILMDRFRDYGPEDLIETHDYRVWTELPLGGGEYSRPVKLSTFAPYPPLRPESAVDDIIEASLDRFGEEPLTDTQIQRELPFGNLAEAFDDGDGPAVDTADDETARNAALKAVYDESIRRGDPGGYTPIRGCVDRLNRYLPEAGGMNSKAQAWRDALKDIPEAYRSTREVDGEMHVRVESRPFLNIGENENDGGPEHWATMKDAYVPLTRLGFVVDIPEQDTSDMPDAVARLDDALDVPDDGRHRTTLDAVETYREDYPLLDRLADVEDAYIESEHTTGDSQPSQTVQNVMQAVADGRRCLLLCRERTAARVATTLLEEPQGCHATHDVDGERRYYTLTKDVTIDGETMTRPGSSDNVWVYDETDGEYVLRDDDGTEHARFGTAAEIVEDASAYPDEGDRRVKEPVMPRYDPDDLDIIIVPEDADHPSDLLVYQRDGAHIPLTELLDAEDQADASDEDREHGATRGPLGAEDSGGKNEAAVGGEDLDGLDDDLDGLL